MRISEDERQHIIRVVASGTAYGFGNMISHLQAAWAKSLRDQYGMPDTAKRDGYPIAMHDDLMLLGFWDESGKSYSMSAMQGMAHVIDETKGQP